MGVLHHEEVNRLSQPPATARQDKAIITMSEIETSLFEAPHTKQVLETKVTSQQVYPRMTGLIDHEREERKSQQKAVCSRWTAEMAMRQPGHISQDTTRQHETKE